MTSLRTLKNWERTLRRTEGADLSDPEDRRRALFYVKWFDHEFLRKYWTNFFEIAPGVYRSNHPTPERFRKIRDMGIGTVLNLRGQSTAPHHLLEKEICAELGLKLFNARMHARRTASREEIQHLIATFREIEKPFVMHCKSGADRAGFASAIWMMVMEGQPVESAREMLSAKYVHLKFTKTGVLDYTLDRYQARNAKEAISFEDWIATEYDHEQLLADYKNRVPVT